MKNTVGVYLKIIINGHNAKLNDAWEEPTPPGVLQKVVFPVQYYDVSAAKLRTCTRSYAQPGIIYYHSKSCNVVLEQTGIAGQAS